MGFMWENKTIGHYNMEKILDEYLLKTDRAMSKVIGMAIGESGSLSELDPDAVEAYNQLMRYWADTKKSVLEYARMEDKRFDELKSNQQHIERKLDTVLRKLDRLEDRPKKDCLFGCKTAEE